MPEVTYEEALAYIASLAPRGWRLGLDRMQAFAERAGLTDALGAGGGPQYLHVAGTNGKGSVTAYLQSLMVEGGFRTGAFFSPFVYTPRERVQLGRELISKADLARLTDSLRPIAESFSDTPFGGITEFEFKTALGFQYWKEKACEWVALEVGLGGRLDATNVVTPRASAIVSIGLDHTSILGHTVEEIAYEKAGVIKPGVPVVVGEVAPSVDAVIQRCADEISSPVWRLGRDVVWKEGRVSTPAATYSGLMPGIPGAMQEHNLALAVGTMNAAGLTPTEGQARRGAQLAYAPGRFEQVSYRGTTVLLDGAHNPAAAKVLMDGLERVLGSGEQVTLVTNMVAGHDPADFYREIAPVVSSAHVVPIDFHRALPVEETGAAIRPLVPKVSTYERLGDGLDAAVDEGRTVLVTGSFYLVGEVGKALGIGT